MFREWIKDLLKEVFSDDIEHMHHTYLEKKYGDVVEDEIKELLAPLRTDVVEFRNTLNDQLKAINKSVTVEVKATKKMIDTALAKTIETLPAKLESLEVNVDGIQEVLNKKVKSTVTSEITKNNDSYYRNNLVINVKSQFKSFCEDHDFVGGITKKSTNSK